MLEAGHLQAQEIDVCLMMRSVSHKMYSEAYLLENDVEQTVKEGRICLEAWLGFASSAFVRIYTAKSDSGDCRG